MEFTITSVKLCRLEEEERLSIPISGLPKQWKHVQPMKRIIGKKKTYKTCDLNQKREPYTF